MKTMNLLKDKGAPMSGATAGIDKGVRDYLNEWSRPVGTIASAKDATALVVLAWLLVSRRWRVNRP